MKVSDNRETTSLEQTLRQVAGEYQGMSTLDDYAQRHGLIIYAYSQDLNGSSIQILNDLPSAIEFSRLVRISRPVLILGKTVVLSVAILDPVG